MIKLCYGRAAGRIPFGFAGMHPTRARKLTEIIRTQVLWPAIPLLVLTSVAACGGGGGSASTGGGGGGGGGGNTIALGSAQAIWLNATTIVWPNVDTTHTYKLYYSASANLSAGTNDIAGEDNVGGVALTAGTLSASLQNAFPQYASATALTLPTMTAAQISSLLTDQLAVVQYSGSTPANGTEVQIGAVLDNQYGSAAGGATLGVSFNPATDVPTFQVWAPTATSVQLNLYPTAGAASPIVFAMTENSGSGVWSYTAADASWTNVAYYTYTVSVFSRAASSTLGYGAVVANTVTDPYSVSLNGDGSQSMVVNLADAAATPAGWPGALIATSATPTDSVVYELHVRDFSVNDSSVPAAHQGKFLAFTDSAANGMSHLAALASAGLTHVHLLPAFDFSSVDALTCTNPTTPISTGAGTAAELAVIANQNNDCFNWGYDPFHYGAPQGSYSTNPANGLSRVLEFRQMVQALHAAGLRVILDVVYNHTSASGEDPHSVLDQIVPGYYQRLDGNGVVENNSCCSDTATERVMMAKLMDDTLVQWAGQYKVDAFRFDTMELIPKAAMIQALALVNAVTAADGRGHTYFYGEGWTAPSQVSAVITPASQLNMAGTGIGTFNDRLRDGVRGGSPFDSGGALVTNQGFINGLCYDLNGNDQGDDCSGDANDVLFPIQNRISVGLAGNLANFPLSPGVSGAQVNYFGSPTGYTIQPQENLVYVACHDNETLFDISQYKHPTSTSVADVGRAQAVGLSVAVLSQGVAFIHGGDDLLRSKSGDSNSYNSGDYFNRIYWDGSVNNWSAGLPPQNTGNNASNMATLGPLLISQAVPDTGTIQATSARVQEFLKIRKATDLFRLGSAALINSCVSFPDQGAQVHGLIVEQILGVGCVPGTSSGYNAVVILYNASTSTQSFTISSAAYANAAKGTASGNVSLHPAQLAGSDATLLADWNFTSTASGGTFTVPARTTAVFVQYH
jgi:pullulanase